MDNKVSLSKSISNKITSLSFLMTCVILIYHCFSDGPYINNLDNTINNFLYFLINELATIAMYYFFFTSGFLLFVNLNKNNTNQKIQKRIFSLFIPYIFWQIIIFLSKITILKQQISINEFINTVFLFKMWPPNGPLWYVYIVFLLSLFCPILIRTYENKRITTFLIPIISVLSYYLYLNLPLNNVFFENSYLTNLFHYLSAYIFGSYAGYATTNQMRKKEVLTIIIPALVLNTFLGLNILRESLYSLIPLLIVLFTDFKLNINKRICGLSFLIYALHPITKTIFLNFINNTLLSFNLPYTIINIVSVLSILVITLLISFVIKSLIKHLCPNALIIITGGR